MKRRAFLRTTALGMGAWAGLPIGSSGTERGSNTGAGRKEFDVPTDNYQAPGWLRYSRTLYFDGYSPPLHPHLDDFDAKRLLKILAELGGNMLRFQPIGYWAYYPSRTFPVHPELGGRDLIDEVSRECRRANVHLYCYTGYGVAVMDPDSVAQRPEYAGWLLRDPDGKPYGTDTQYGDKAWMALCVTGDIYREAIRKVVTEICQYDVDGLYFDAPSAYRDFCFCDSCRANFAKFSGMDLDRVRDERDMEASIAWYDWANQLTMEDLLDFRKIIHDHGKFMLCHNGVTWEGTALPFQYRIPEGFMVEQTSQVYQRLTSGMMGASMARPSKKLAQMYLGSYCVSDIGQPPESKPWAVHNTNLEDGDEIRMEGFTDLACGNAPLYATANRLYYNLGSGSIEPAKEVFELMRRVEPIMKDSVPVSYVTIVPTWESLQLWRTRRSSWNVMMSQGFVLAMLDERISFDVNPSTEMSEAWLQQQRVIALCGASGVSNADARRLAAWVREGGGLLATYDTGLYDEKGEVRRDGGALAEVLGVEMQDGPLDNRPDCYYRVQRPHPALGEYAQGAMVMGDGQLVPVRAKEGATVLADCWNLGYRESRGPAIVCNPYGRGRSIYISGSLEAHYVSSRVASIQRLLGSLVRYLAKDTPAPFNLTAPGGVYGMLWSTPAQDRVLWVLADVGFKGAAAGRMRQQYLPVPNVELKIRVPEGRQVKGLHLMRAGREVPFTITGGYAAATIPALHIAEVVHMQLG